MYQYLMEMKDSYLTGIKCRFERDDRNWADCFRDSICGEYSITDDAIKKLDSSHENKRKITNVLAQRRCRGINVPLRITSDNQGKDGDWSLETIQYLLSQYPTSPLEMLDESLVNILT